MEVHPKLNDHTEKIALHCELEFYSWSIQYNIYSVTYGLWNSEAT